VTQMSEERYTSYLCEKIGDIANEAISSRGVFLLGVSGGSIISFLSEGLPKISSDWSSWRVFLVDERLVPESDPESTYGLYKRKLLPSLPSPLTFLAVDPGLLEDPAGAAKDYEAKLRSLWPSSDVDKASFGMADCLLLGVGPDGHTASLFPGHKALGVKDTWVTWVEDSPKPPPVRVSLTYTFINKASNILVAGKGKEKWDILEKVQEGQDFPIGRVDNPGGHLEWILNDTK